MFANEFILLCKDFAKKRNDVLYETFEETKKICKCIIECYGYILEFRYVKKESAFFKPSSLYCVIRLRKIVQNKTPENPHKYRLSGGTRSRGDGT